MTNPELEEKLREAACFGDIEGVKELISKSVNVNSQHDINGWTALHWAAKRNHLNIVNLLCNHGADKNIATNKGELPGQLTSEGVIKVLLNANLKSPAPASPAPTRRAEEKLPITPNYIRSPPLGYKVDTASPQQNAVQEKRPRLESPAPGRQQQPAAAPAGERKAVSANGSCGQELILRVRVAGGDPDYLELELPPTSLTLESLLMVACQELGLEAASVERVRKMPDTRLRRDCEVARLQDYQAIELVLKQQI